ncbi:MAG: RnfABCDGE type electron transport complex subunit C [Bacilli bacterium]|nr:RnfABCDGE type electron transport complex subunit C [Bacilli bacterium]
MIIHKIKGLHLKGKRNISLANGVQEYLNPKYVYIPLTNGVVAYRSVVAVGDEVLKGQVVALREDRYAHPIHSAISGKVIGIKKMWHESGKMVETLEIENDYQEKVVSTWGQSLDLNLLTKEDIVERVKSCGIVGLGGAGFPTFVKYMVPRKQKLLIVNGVECEPYLSCDSISIRRHIDKLIRGIKYVLKAIGAKKCVIAVKKDKKEVLEVLNKELKKYKQIDIFKVGNYYPAGWERSIVEKVTKKHYMFLPSEIGVIVDNVQTIISVCEAVEENKPLIERMITVSGEGISSPQNFYTKIGVRSRELIVRSGGYLDEEKEGYMIAGGPMTGKTVLDDSLVVSSTLGGIIVLDRKEGLKQPCMGCGKCSLACPAYLVPTEIRKAYEQKDFVALGKLHTMDCVKCGLCSYVCPSRVDITYYVSLAKNDLKNYQSVNNKKGDK